MRKINLSTIAVVGLAGCVLFAQGNVHAYDSKKLDTREQKPEDMNDDEENDEFADADEFEDESDDGDWAYNNQEELPNRSLQGSNAPRIIANTNQQRGQAQSFRKIRRDRYDTHEERNSYDDEGGYNRRCQPSQYPYYTGPIEKVNEGGAPSENVPQDMIKEVKAPAKPETRKAAPAVKKAPAAPAAKPAPAAPAVKPAPAAPAVKPAPAAPAVKPAPAAPAVKPAPAAPAVKPAPAAPAVKPAPTTTPNALSPTQQTAPGVPATPAK